MAKVADKELREQLNPRVPFLRTPYNYDTNAASDESGIFCDPTTEEGRSKTKQEFTQECDPTYIMERFASGADLPLPKREPMYGDFTGVPDYHTAMNIVAAGKSAFMELPHHIRTRFNNDPGEFLAFANDPKNEAELVELGFMVPRAGEPPRDADSAVGGTPAPGSENPLKKAVSKVKEAISGGDKGDD